MPEEDIEFTAVPSRMNEDFHLVLSVDANGIVVAATGTITNETVGTTIAIDGLQDALGVSVTSDGVTRYPDQILLTQPPFVDQDGIGFKDANGVEYDLFALPFNASGAYLVEQGVFGASSTTDISLTVQCFRSGTRISAADGDVPVERLTVGMMVETMDGTMKPICWIGSRVVDCSHHPDPEKVFPVMIASGSFGQGLPQRPLFLSPDHAIYAEGVLIPVKHLINGTTIIQVAAPTVAYYHIELETHDVVLAEGLPTETYLDTGDRGSFSNGSAAIRLHPAWGSEQQEASLAAEVLRYAPLRVWGPEIDAIKRRLSVMSAEALAL